MDKPVLIIEMPELSNESVVSILDFLQEIMNAFECHYDNQIKQHYRQLDSDNPPDFF
jgi:hypothetical protein